MYMKSLILTKMFLSYMSLNVTKRSFGHLDVSGGNSEKAGKSCNVHLQNNTVFVCLKIRLTNEQVLRH